MRHYARDPASDDERVYRIPGLGHLLGVLAEDAAFADELVHKLSTLHSMSGQAIRSRTKNVPVAPTTHTEANALRNNRL